MSFFGPYPVADVIAHLRAQVPALKLISGAGDLGTAIASQPSAVPAAYVLTEETGSRLNDYSSRLRQHLSVAVKVVLWVRHSGTAATGARAVAAMTALEADVRAALLGYVPSGISCTPLAVTRSGNDQYHGNHLVHQVLFESDYVIESTP